MTKQDRISLEADLELPAFRLLDPRLMENSRYREGVWIGYFNREPAPECSTCSTRQKGILAGIALWEVCLGAKNHDSKLFDELFDESSTSETLERIRRHIAEFCEGSDPEAEAVSLDSFSADELLSVPHAQWPFHDLESLIGLQIADALC